jgi:hypothetical protein
LSSCTIGGFSRRDHEVRKLVVSLTTFLIKGRMYIDGAENRMLRKIVGQKRDDVIETA